MSKRPGVPLLLLGCGLLATVLVYLPGLPGEFMFDDHWNILNNNAIQLEELDASGLAEAAGSGTAGPFKRPVAVVSFALNHAFAGLQPGPWKLTNLAIHLLTGLLVYLFCRQLLHALAVPGEDGDPGPTLDQVAAVVACLWLLHPLNLSTVLYVVQRMTSLSALFSLLALTLFLHGRARLRQGAAGWPQIFAAVGLFTPLAILSKESGLLVPVFMLLIELAIFGLACASAVDRRRLLLLYAVLVALPLALGLVYLAAVPEFITAAYQRRPFSLLERLLTEPRVLWFYVQLIFLPRVQALGLFHDDLAVSTGLFTPWTTLPALLAWIAAFAAALRWRSRAPLLAFGVLFFLLGHALESSFLGLELVFEHRNYLPMLGLLLPAVYYLLTVGIPGLADRLPAVLLVLLAGWFLFTTALRASAWGSVTEFSIAQYRHHPQSARSNYQMGRVYAQLVSQVQDPDRKGEYLTEAARLFERASDLQPAFADGLFGLLVLFSSNGIEPPAPLVEELLRRLREEPFGANNVNQVNSLFACRAAAVCELEQGLMGEIIASSRSNPSLSPAMASLLPPAG